MPGSYNFNGGTGSAYDFFTPPKAGGGGSHGVGGFVTNLAGDIRDAAVGVPTGLVHLVEHPVGSLEAMGKSTWQTWSPLYHGDVGKFGHQFYAHPLAPLLDIASVLTGGAGMAGRLAKIGVGTGIVSDASAIGKLAKFSTSSEIKYTKMGVTHSTQRVGKIDGATGKVVYKNVKTHVDQALPPMVRHTASNPMAKAQQLAVHKFVNSLDGHLPNWLGRPLTMEARYNRLETKMMAPRAAALQAQIHAFVRAGKDMTGPNANRNRRMVLVHSYKQLKRMAIEHDPAKPLPQGWAFIRGVPMVKKAGGRNGFFALHDRHTSIEDDLAGFSRRYTVGKDSQKHLAARAGNGSGQLLIVPMHQLHKFIGDGINASKTVKALYHKPIQVWKYLLLGTRPAYFVNNAVGNFLMYSMGHGGTAGVKGFVDALAQVKGERAAIHSMGAASHALKPHWMESNFRDQLNNTFSYSQKGNMSSKLYKYSMFPVTHMVADQFIRRAAISAEMRRSPEVMALMKSGHTFDQAAAKALAGGNGLARTSTEALRTRVSQKVMDTMGDYHSMNSGERALSNIMPFYTWNRHAMRFTKAALRDHPGRLDFTAKVGAQGTEKTKELLGNIPDFLKGSIPMSLLGMKSSGGRIPTMTTSGINPLATVPEVLDFARALVSSDPHLKPGAAIASQINPILSGTIQHLTGTSLSTGARLQGHRGGLIGDVLASTGEGLPWGTFAKYALQGNPKPKVNAQNGSTKPFLFEKNKKTVLEGILGFPLKQMDPAAAESLYNKDNHKKKGRKSAWAFR